MEQTKNERANWNKLFSLYKSLVKPFQEFENRSYRKRELERTAESFKRAISFGYKGTIPEIFSHTLIWAIPSIIVFFVILNVVPMKDGGKLYDYMYGSDSWIDSVVYAIQTRYAHLFKGNFGWIYSILLLIVALIICYVLYPYLICLICLFPLMTAVSVIPRAHKLSKVKKALKTYEEQLLPQAEAAIQEAGKKIAPDLKRIPRNYRNSHALAFFSDSFFNFKVNNLQEAINLYDQYLHQQRMEQNQLESQAESMDAINALSRQMDEMQYQIDTKEETVINYNTYYY